MEHPTEYIFLFNATISVPKWNISKIKANDNLKRSINYFTEPCSLRTSWSAVELRCTHRHTEIFVLFSRNPGLSEIRFSCPWLHLFKAVFAWNRSWLHPEIDCQRGVMHAASHPKPVDGTAMMQMPRNFRSATASSVQDNRVVKLPTL